MAENTKKLTRKEKIAEGLEKGPKRKKRSAQELKSRRQEATQATLRNSPISARKMRMIVELIRGKNVEKAMALLKFSTRAGAPELSKLIRSAISNWEQKNEGVRVDSSNLYVSEAYVDSARMLKRFRPAPQGRAHRIRKRSNHVTLVIDTKEELN